MGIEIGLILAFITLALALIGFGIAISTIIMSKDIRKDAVYTKFWNAPDALITALAELRKRTQIDSDGNGPPHPPDTGMRWVLDHTACDQGHYGHSIWKQVSDISVSSIDCNDNH